MTVFSAASLRPSRTRAHVVPIVLGGAAALGAVALVAYLLWPTWGAGGASAPDRLPVSVGGTLFNVPTTAIRMKIQRHSGPQERIDLDVLYPSLEPPGAPRHVTADTVETAVQSIDRIFLSIAAHHDALAGAANGHDLSALSRPDLAPARGRPDDANVPRRHALRQRGPLFRRKPGADRALHARCGDPGMCLSERRVGGADSPSASPQLAVAMAGGRGGDGEVDGAIARAEGLSTVFAVPRDRASPSQQNFENNPMHSSEGPARLRLFRSRFDPSGKTGV